MEPKRMIRLSNDAGPVLVKQEDVVAFVAMQGTFDREKKYTRVLLANGSHIDVREPVVEILGNLGEE